MGPDPTTLGEEQLNGMRAECRRELDALVLPCLAHLLSSAVAKRRWSRRLWWLAGSGSRLRLLLENGWGSAGDCYRRPRH